jgi:glycosyltransferase involved in cell wall biosynthesis
MAEPRRRKISAVIACYRDAEAVPQMHERLTGVFRKLDVDYEIVFVNDASPDDARTVLAELSARDPHVVVVNHTRNFGSQSAFTSGMRIATGDAVVLLDGDLQDPPELIEDFYARWLDGYDVVYGVRVQREASFPMRAAYKLFYRIFQRLSYIWVPVDAGDFSLMDRRVVAAVNALPEKNRFVRGLRAWVGYRQTGVPYVRPERAYGVTTNSFLRNLGWARKAIISFSYSLLDVITALALFVVAISAIFALVEIVLRIASPGIAPRGITTVLVVILFLGGVQLLCLSIIGSYLAHIYDEVKRRPAYIVESVVRGGRESFEGGPEPGQTP